MSWYSIALFLHIVGALGLFAGVSVEQVGLRGLRRASTTAALREWLGAIGAFRRVDGPAALVVLGTGIFMVRTSGGMRPWVGAGLLGMVLMALVGATMTRRAMKAIVAVVPGDDRPVPLAVRQRAEAPLLRTASALRAALLLGIVFVMAVKPGAPGAALALGAAVVVGALAPWFPARGTLETREYGAEH